MSEEKYYLCVCECSFEGVYCGFGPHECKCCGEELSTIREASEEEIEELLV